jgi:hypothetical protein
MSMSVLCAVLDRGVGGQCRSAAGRALWSAGPPVQGAGRGMGGRVVLGKTIGARLAPLMG